MALPHLRAVDEQRHAAVAIDAQPRVERDAGVRRPGRQRRERVSSLHGLLGGPRRGAMDGAPDARVRAAAAEHVRHRVVDLRIARVGMALEQPGGGEKLRRLAVAALRHLLGHPGLDERPLRLARERFDREHALTRDIGDRQHAAVARLAVDEHHAASAGTGAAAVLHALQAEVFAQRPEQRRVGRAVELPLLAVHLELDCHALFHRAIERLRAAESLISRKAGSPKGSRLAE
jgi:hypothetical protein